MSFSVSAQSLTAVVCDEKTKEPISDVVIYLDGTSYAVTTNVSGKFELRTNSQINTRLVVRHLGYENRIIENPFSTLPDTIYIKEVSNELGEVTVSAKKPKYSREQRMDAFSKQFLGTTTAGKQCNILNKDDINLVYDSGTNTLIASANVPIQIENKYLGYMINFDLKEFRILYKYDTLQDSEIINTYFIGACFFADLNNPNERSIQNNRKMVYDGSVYNFIKHLYNNSLDASDFRLRLNGRRLLQRDCFALVDSLSMKLVKVNQRIQNIRQFDFTMSTTLEVSHKGENSHIFFRTNEFWIDSTRIVSPIDKIVFYGSMGDQRLGDLLPLDYTPY